MGAWRDSLAIKSAAALAEDLDLFPSIDMVIMTICNSSYKGPATLF